MKLFLSIVASFVALLTFPVAASAETFTMNGKCFKTDEAVDSIVNTHKEIPLMIGTTSSKSEDSKERPVMVLFWNPTTLTYTILHMFDKKGISCVIADGQAEPYTPGTQQQSNKKKQIM